MAKKKREHRINDEIIARVVRVDGNVIPIQQALLEAEKSEMDLVLINDKTDPVICKIVDYQKFIYEQKRKEKE